jgi:2-oxoglutarate ferredoxin oxidoreductase subunit alpha
MKYNLLFGGKAGQGTNILTHILAESLIEKGFYAFYYRDYQSLIRGGHSFNVLTFSENHVFSHESKYDLIVALDEKTLEIHKKNLKKKGIIISGKHPNMYFAGKIFKILGLEFNLLDKKLKELKKRYEYNLKEAREGYESCETIIEIKSPKKKLNFYSGSQGIAEGAIKSGLDIYYAYPMTPATAVLGELAQKQKEKKILVLELENEIAVANAGVGSAITGAKTMVGTSGGGFDLMTEAFSMAGIAEAPLVFYLAQRPGPGSGVPTYTSQGDLHLARHAGHGEIPRVVLAPGDPIEAEELTSQAFYLSQKFGVPSIIISDKHLAESFYSCEKKPKIVRSKKLTKFGRYNSYEKSSDDSATEDAEEIKKGVEKRLKKRENLKKEIKKFEGFKIYGKKKSKNCIVFWGSTKGAVLDAIKGLDVCAIQILQIEPFAPCVEKILSKKKLILVENNSTGQLSEVIREKTGIEIKNKILKYDSRPFLCDELKKEIEKKIK